MGQTEEADARLAALEVRMRRLEDEVAIYRLLASYSPAVDSCSEEATAALWAADGSYDFGGAPLKGADKVGSLIHLDSHQVYVRKGCAHVMSLPMVTLDGDSAVATGYSRVYLHEGKGWKVERVSANRWELVRTADGWKVATRVNRLMDGSPQGRELLARGLNRRQEIPA